MTALNSEPCVTATSFPPLLAMAEVSTLEEACRAWGVNRRIALCLATQSREQLAATLSTLASDDEDAAVELIEGVAGLIGHHRGLVELFESVQARLFLLADDAFGAIPDEEEPA